MKKVSTERAKFWQQHIEAAKSLGVSPRQYCIKHGLQPSAFYHWRRRLAGAFQNPRASNFLPVVVSTAETPTRSREVTLPNAEWVAEVMAHLIRSLA